MGTPEFAVPGLKILVENQFNIVGVITAPDKPKGRGQQLAVSPVKEYALSQNLNILQPVNLKNTDFLNELKIIGANLQVVVAFRMLPEVVWAMPLYGTFNLHASLLPQYRGAAPINWAIINGEIKTGVTTFFLKQEIDTGDIIDQEEEPILKTDDAGSLYERLMNKGAGLILKTTELIKSGDIPLQQQVVPAILKHAPKIFRETCKINWSRSSNELFNFIRGLSPYPGAWTDILDNKVFKIYKSTPLEQKEYPESTSDQYFCDNENILAIKTGDGWLGIDELQLQGKKRMTTVEYLRGYRFKL